MWRVRGGPEHNFLDGRTLVHHIHLFNQVTGGEHNLELLLGNPSCAVCHRPFAGVLGALDPAAHVEEALVQLRSNHDSVMAYLAAHKLPIRVGLLHEVTPNEMMPAEKNGVRFLIPFRGGK